MAAICDLAKERVATVLKPGDHAVDATMGNGWDTLFLAEKVGESGKVFAFDVQEFALEQTRKKLVKLGLEGRCELFQRGHEELATVVTGELGAVMFNLGYLPYADQEIQTHPETTLAALEAAVQLLREGGMLSVICYRGHPGGEEEAQAVWKWAHQLEECFQVVAPNNYPEEEEPYLITLKKVSVSSQRP